jgi:NAD(P)-dependent dehydrogenase (short-subunit alcohol dehydrogenase family)
MTMQDRRTACVFGAGGGIGGALVRALAAREDIALVHAGSRRAPANGPKVRPFHFDLTDEASIAAAAATMADDPPEIVVVATGALAFADGAGPEKSLGAIDPVRMANLFALNTIGPAMIAKHIVPLLRRDRPAVLAVLSARVGSIGDNRLGGWHSYRASKAALNMLVRTIAVELGRTHPQAVLVVLHPGTVDTPLSRPFQRNLREGQLMTSEQAAAHLLSVIDSLTPADSGGFFAWDGQPIAF